MTKSHKSIRTVKNLLAYFREELIEAFEEVDLEASEETEAYLVHLLDGFVRMKPDFAQEVGFDKPAAFYLGEALNSPGDRRIEVYRRLGDASLFNCGFFEAYLSRRLVNSTYYQNMGRLAYQKLSHMPSIRRKQGSFQVIFDELAANFEGVVQAFQWLGRSLKSNRVSVPKDVFERADAQGAISLKSLREAGYIVSTDSGEA